MDRDKLLRIVTRGRERRFGKKSRNEKEEERIIVGKKTRRRCKNLLTKED